jgi:hypothetical protein
MVEPLLAALTLPPRRPTSGAPAGGYADVATRGHPEQILPSQFALDDLEFVRRHAENELLYFRREEPRQDVREELVVLLDQGVRTWEPSGWPSRRQCWRSADSRSGAAWRSASPAPATRADSSTPTRPR